MNIAIITAGGSGKRMKSSDIPKQFLMVCNKPIIIYTLEIFEACKDIDAIIICCIEPWIMHLEEMIKKYQLKKVKLVIPGGNSGQQTIYRGIVAAESISQGDNDIVLIHDSVRPLIDVDLITKNIENVKLYRSSITVAPANETVAIKEKLQIVNVLERDKLLIARAPQAFFLSDIMQAHKKANAEKKIDFVDSCHMMNYYGHPLYYMEGPVENIKITTQLDYYMLRAIIQMKEDQQFD